MKNYKNTIISINITRARIPVLINVDNRNILYSLSKIKFHVNIDIAVKLKKI